MSRTIEKIIDEQVQRWEVARKKGERATPSAAVPVITVSREAGSQGAAVARRLAERLNLCLFDREIIQAVAKSAKLSERIVESLDEKARIALEDWFLVTVGGRQMLPGQFREHLIKVVGAIGQQGNAIVIGRGAGFILPPEQCFRVRCVASLDSRVNNWAAEHGLSEGEAKRAVEAEDRQREEFIRVQFEADMNDPLHYDLVINTDTIGMDVAADLVEFALVKTGRMPGPLQ